MKKVVFKIISLILLCIIFSNAVACTGYYLSESDEQEHDVILVLVDKNGIETRKTLTSQKNGATIYTPSDYKIFSSLIDGYVIEKDVWYSTETLSSPIYFPSTMPDRNLELYASVRSLTNIQNINFANSLTVKNYFSAHGVLKDEYLNTPDENNETSYYEISEYSVATIKNVFRYYPATQKIMLLRGYSVSNNIVGSLVIQDEFSIGIAIDLLNKTILCKGVYSRNGISSFSASSGSVTITYDVDKISIDDATQPLFPNFTTVNYSSTISNATNYSKMQELWNSDGYDYAEKCYAQANTLLKSLNEKILVFY